jgi:hypothetical protein
MHLKKAVLGSVAIATIIPLLIPVAARAGFYGEAYYEGYYQSYYQSTYYAQGNYLTLTKPVSALQSVDVTGTVSKGSGSFVIDHPLDPKNKLLYHSFVESPDVKNVYDGVVQLDEYGGAVVSLPDYFLALNTEYRYLATSISGPMPNLHLAEGVHRRFRVGKPIFELAGGEPHGVVSWQVTGIRKDPLILTEPIIVEVEKGANEIVRKGQCVFEPLCK